MGTGFFRGRCAFGKFNADTVIFEYKAVLRPVVELSAGQDNGIAAADYIAGNFAIYTGTAVNSRCAQCLLILPNHGITADTAFPHEQSAADDGIILHSGIPSHGGVLSDIGAALCNGVICKDCIAADNCIFTGDGILRNPCTPLLVEVVIAFHIAAEHPGKDILGQIRHRTDTVQVGVVGMGNVGDPHQTK